MRIRRHKQAGFSVVELLIVLVVFAVLSLVAYGVHNRLATKTTTSTSPAATVTTQSPNATNVSPAPTVSTTSDLDAALSVLNQNDPSAVNTTDSSQLSSQANTF